MIKVAPPLSKSTFLEYSSRLQAHIAAVQDAGLYLGVPMAQLSQHDLSKWQPDEFVPYARAMVEGDRSGFAAAWLLHLQRNPHHWQHWIFPQDYTPAGSSVENGVSRMPDKYALEMIADWMGASVSYTGDEDMSDWLTKNIPTISLHTRTTLFVREVLDSLGYADIIHTHKFAHEK